MSEPIDALDVIDRVALFNGGLVADDLNRVHEGVRAVFAAARTLSADLEHSIAVAAFNGVTIPKDNSIRAAIDALDAALDHVCAPDLSVDPPIASASTPCSMGVGCDEAGVCFAAAHGEPKRCPKEPTND